jgi:hypothetical protein
MCFGVVFDTTVSSNRHWILRNVGHFAFRSVGVCVRYSKIANQRSVARRLTPAPEGVNVFGVTLQQTDFVSAFNIQKDVTAFTVGVAVVIVIHLVVTETGYNLTQTLYLEHVKA